VDSNVVPAGKRDKAVSFVVGIVSRTLSVFIPVKELVVWDIFIEFDSLLLHTGICCCIFAKLAETEILVRRIVKCYRVLTLCP